MTARSIVVRFSTSALLSIGAATFAGCSSSSTIALADASADAAADQGSVETCTVAADCGVNPGASCAHVCRDGSNPCSYACVDHACVPRGCPGDGDAASVDVISTDASDSTTGDSVAADTGAPECSPACTSGSTCVRKQFNGGAAFPVSDAGTCPTGRHPSDGFCAADPVFSCASTPAACAGVVTCACAASLCGSYACDGTSGNQVDCVLNAP